MKSVFADSQFWVARANPRDQWAPLAKQAQEALGKVRIVTTDEVLIEFLNALRGSESLRKTATKMTHAILDDPNVKVVHQSRRTFLDGLERYEKRQDKQYSLPDCISMCAMEEEGITEILTNDHHFEQEGFVILMKESA